MAGTVGSPDFIPVENPVGDARLVSGAPASAPAGSIFRSGGAAPESSPPAREAAAPAAVPKDAVEIQTPDQVSVAYHVDQKAQQIYVQFVDSKTGDVINQFPPSQVLAFEDHIAQYLESRQQAERAPAGASPAADAKNVKEG